MYEQADRGEGYDLVECTEFGFGFIPWIINHNKPLVTRLHGSSGQIAFYETNKTTNILTDFIRQAELLLLPYCDKLITYSTANQLFWNKRLTGAVVTMISPAFSTSISCPMPFAQRENFGLVTARIQQWKGPLELCGALSKLSPGERPVIKWVGRDMPYSDTESTAQLLERRFFGVWGVSVLPQKPLKNAEIVKLQQQVKFGLVPSTWDMFNFTLTEFLGAGTPVICADGAGASCLIEHGINGFKYPANDENALAECIRQLTGMNEEAYIQMAIAGLETVRQELSDDKIISQNLQQYDSLIKNFKPPAVDEYIGGIFKPDEKNYTIESVLDKQPLKLLLSYSLKRLKAKLWKP
jgi:glycosyltransferase involved in cell wall biosynthesis